MNLLSLVGEQPIPVLLTWRALRPRQHLLLATSTTRRVAENLAALSPGAQAEVIEPYDIVAAVKQIADLWTSGTVVNLTGGTKPMALAAYEVARRRGAEVVYLQSEGPHNVLYRYRAGKDPLALRERRLLPALITLDDYLRAYGLGRPVRTKPPANRQEAELRRWLSEQVDECWNNLVYEAFEIDFLLRRGNRVAVLEAKWKARNDRHGIDQLNTIAGRAYLGTYTGKILVTRRPLGPNLRRLAEARHIHAVHLEDGRGRMLGRAARERLRRALDRALGMTEETP